MSDISFNNLSRREALGAAGAIGLTLIGGDALAQPRTPPMKVLSPSDFQPKLITANSHLTRGAVQAARNFKLGDKAVALKLDTARPHAVVKKFELSAAAARKLGRKENLVEATACGILDAGSNDAIRARLAQLKVPQTIRDKSAFFFIRGGHRVTDNTRDGLVLSKEFPLKHEKVLIAGLSKEKDQTVLTLLLQSRRGAVTIRGFAKKPAPNTGTTTPPEPPPPETTTHPDEGGGDSGVCFAGCVAVLAGLSPFLAGLCGACVLSFAAEPFSLPITIGACALCVLPPVAVAIGCLIVCDE